MNDNLKDSQVI